MICVSIQNKDYDRILEILSLPEVEMAEIRLDSCTLTDEQLDDLFANSDTPLVATCRGDAVRLAQAIEAGARFADLELEASAEDSRRIQTLCRECGTELIRSYHDFTGTPSEAELQKILARCFRYGADIAKIVTIAHNADDIARLNSLYGVVLEGVDSMQGHLIAFGMGDEVSKSRVDCLRRGAPFTYAALDSCDIVAPGQLPAKDVAAKVYGGIKPFEALGVKAPCSKSFAQRAILAAALAKGTSVLHGYTPCEDSEAALKVAEALGAIVCRREGDLIITGPDRIAVPESLFVGESGLLARLCIPMLAAIGPGSTAVQGKGTLLKRPLTDAPGIMAAFGVLLSGENVPMEIRGKLIPGTADVSGKGGSQLISGLLMALPLCSGNSSLYVAEPKSIPYMYMTLDVLRHFGIRTRSEMEGDAELLENNDWSACDGISFAIKGGQRYRPAIFDIEGDWSAAANFLVAGAIFGKSEILGLDTKSLQADITILDVLVNAGACVSELEDGSVCVRKAPLESFSVDLSNAPDLFPIVSVLAAFCSGESRIEGLSRLVGKESNRADAILQMLMQMGVEARAEGDELCVCGETLASRCLSGRLLKGGEFSSRNDHRMAMALAVASLGCSSPLEIDDKACVAKSFPGFFEDFLK